MHGLDLVRKIRSNSSLSGVQVIMLSNLGYPDQAGARQMGVVGALTKPVMRSRLLSSVCSALCPPAVEQPARGSDLAEALERPAGPHRARILVAEDDRVNQKMVARILEALDCRVDLAETGWAAVQAVCSRQYDAIFMDCHMPELDGYGAAEEIRRRFPSGPRTPIIALTADSRPSDQARCMAVGMDDYLAKPVTTQTMRKVLHRWIEDRRDPQGDSMAPGVVDRRAPDVPPDSRGAGSVSLDQPPVVSSPEEETRPIAVPVGSRIVPEAIAGSADGIVLDNSVVANLRSLQSEDDPDLVSEVFGVFLVDGKKRMDTIHEAVTNTDVETLTRAAHTLKGSSIMVGARQIAATCEQLERVAARPSCAEMGQLLSRLEAEFGQVELVMLGALRV